MEFFDVIKNRGSYRGEFLPIDVGEEDLNKILDAGIRAPSGYNLQTTTFIAVRDAKNKAEIATELNAQELTLMAHEPENMEAAFTIIGERRKTLVPGFLFFRVSIITRFKKPHMYNRKRNFWVCMS